MPNASVSGALEVFPSAFIFWNTGLSLICRRIHIDTASSTIEIRNGTRHPQLAKASSPTAKRVPITISSAANSPKVAVVWMKLV